MMREACDTDALKALAAMAAKPVETPKQTTATSYGESARRLLVPEFLRDSGISFRNPVSSGAWTKYVLDECPFDSNHKAPDSYVSQHDAGAVTFHCSHDSCCNNKWQQFKAVTGKPQGHHYDPPLPPKVKNKRPARMSTDHDSDDDGPDEQDIRGYDVTDRNDIGNAEHFKVRHGDKLRHCYAWKKWLVWDGTRWKLDGDGTPIRLAKDTVMEIFRDGLNSHDGDIIKLAEESAKASRLQAMISLAAPELPIDVDDLDTNGWLLNCPNGTVDLRTGKLQPHERWQNITKLCPTEFHPDATAPKWEQFVRDIFVDDDLISFVQRLVGYCLTGDVSEQKLPIFHGNGANGKSTFLNGFMDVVGSDYTMQSMPDFLMEKRGESHPTEKASLFGKRFVSCVETEASRKLAESTVKMLTGGEKIMARRMREDFWEFQPTHKLILCTNHKPVVAGQDHGIWRRLLLVPFTQRFEGPRIDKALPEKLRTEATGILAWLVRGCIEWQRVGLNPPAIVTNATNQYRTNEDTIGLFIEEQCQTGKNLAIAFKAFYGAFAAWCEESGHDCPAKKTVGTWLGENGFHRGRSNGVVWSGLMLNPVFDDSYQ